MPPPALSPEATVSRFYEQITAKNLREAWELQSPSRQASLQYDSWTAAYANTRSVTAQVTPLEQTVDSASVDLDIVAVDSQGTGVITKTFAGTWKLVLIDNAWRLDTASIRDTTPVPPTPTPLPAPRRAATEPPAIVFLAKVGNVGDTLTNGNWQMTVERTSAQRAFGRSNAQGIFVAIRVVATNNHNRTATLNSSDFIMRAPNSMVFKYSSDGGYAADWATASIDGRVEINPFLMEVQPGLRAPFVLVFDVNPALSGYQLVFDRVAWRIPLN